MSIFLRLWALAFLIAVTGCKEELRQPNSLSIKAPWDPRAGFADFITGLSYLVEEEPLTLNISRENNRFEVIVHSSGHDHGPIEPVVITLTENGAVLDESSAGKGKQELEQTLHIFVKGCEAAGTKPIVMVSSVAGVSLDDGIELLEFMALKGVNHIVVLDDHYTGPIPRMPAKKRKLPSSHPPTPPHIDHSGPLRVNPVNEDR